MSSPVLDICTVISPSRRCHPLVTQMVTLSRRACRPVSRSTNSSHDSLTVRLRHTMSKCFESLTRQLPVRPARLHDGARPTVPRGYRSVASTLPPHGCPRDELLETPSLLPVARPESSSCPRSSVPVARAESLSCARLSNPVARIQSRSAPSFLAKFPSRRTPPRNSVARFFAKRAAPPGFPDDSAGPIHGPRSHEPIRSRGCPRDRTSPLHGSPILRDRLRRPVAQPTKPTSCMSRPRHEVAAARLRLPDASTFDLTARGSRTAGFAPPPSFPGDESHTAARCTRTTERLHRPVSQTVEPLSLHGSPARRRHRRRSGCPKHRQPLPSHRLLERWDRAPPPGYPSSRARPTALIRFAKPSSPRGCPLGAADLAARMPMLEALHFDSVALFEAFPHHAVTCVMSGSRCDRLTSWSPR